MPSWKETNSPIANWERHYSSPDIDITHAHIEQEKVLNTGFLRQLQKIRVAIKDG